MGADSLPGSTDHNARALAADLLAKTKHTRLLVRQLRRAKAKLNHTTTNHTPVTEGSETQESGGNEHSVWIGNH